MCGIVGTLVLNGSSFRVSEDFIIKMRETMIHRGPDGAGVWVSKNGRVGFGHRRLSIIDLSEAAAQPMCNEDGSLWISFNGEIYNHGEIRRELEARGGHQWKTDHSDTEMILHAFEEWGVNCIHKFRGMFALALWDDRKKQLWLIRDRIGVKPLYYSIHNGRLNFASEIKALLQDPAQKRGVNEEAFFHYLSFMTAPAPSTLFEGIQKLPAGSWLNVDVDGGIQQERYWDVLDNMVPLDGLSESLIAERVLDELKIAVKFRKVSDVPVGVFLSGGIDSSANAALFSENEKDAIQTFTIGYQGNHKLCQNETEYARKMAALVNADYNECLLSVDDLIDFLPTMVRLQDEPIADPVCFPVYYVAKMARDNRVIVAQVGEGADELFIGYPGWRRELTLQQYDDLWVPKSLKKLGLTALRYFGKEESAYYEWLRRGSVGQPIFWGGTWAFTDVEKKRLLSPRLREKFKGRTSWEALQPIRKRFEEKTHNHSHLRWMTYLDLNFRLPELLLMRVDKMTMGVSLESRVPFLDHKLVELAMSIPDSLKIKNGTLKYILKEAVRGVIPDELIDRKKQGFGVPVHEWLFDKLGDYTKNELSKFCDATDFFDKKQVMRLLEQRQGEKPWFLLNFAMWHNEYISNN